MVLGDTEQKHHKACDVSADLALAASPADPLRGFASGLSWSHYRTLTKVRHRVERLFYEIAGEGPPEVLTLSSDPAVDQFMNGKVEGPIPFHYDISGKHWSLLQ